MKIISKLFLTKNTITKSESRIVTLLLYKKKKYNCHIERKIKNTTESNRQPIKKKLKKYSMACNSKGFFGGRGKKIQRIFGGENSTGCTNHQVSKNVIRFLFLCIQIFIHLLFVISFLLLPFKVLNAHTNPFKAGSFYIAYLFRSNYNNK